MNGHIHIKIDQKQKEKLIVQSKKVGLNLSSYIRLMLRQALNNHKAHHAFNDADVHNF